MLVCASVILTLSLGTRHSFGLFLQPMSMDNGWGREVFGFAVATQNLIWGLTQPLTGMLADRFGAGRVLFAGGLLYAIGLVLMLGGASAIEALSPFLSHATPLRVTQLAAEMLVELVGITCTLWATRDLFISHGLASPFTASPRGVPRV